jgi:hypothetical protein|tara:strand:+ start:1656 stop:2063 length:408 start_codon:yes stop_codon:yes gene_type:complete
MNRKYLRSKKKEPFKSKFRSGLEKTFAALYPKKEFVYEPFDIPYTTHRKYKPDFVHTPTGKLIECKGFFRQGDTLKYKAIRDCSDKELIFVLSDPFKKVRKGAKITMAQWCDKEGFKYFTVQQKDELMNYVTNNV